MLSRIAATGPARNEVLHAARVMADLPQSRTVGTGCDYFIRAVQPVAQGGEQPGAVIPAGVPAHPARLGRLRSAALGFTRAALVWLRRVRR